MAAVPIIAVGILGGGVSAARAVNIFDAAGNYYPHGHKTAGNRNLQVTNGIAADSAGSLYFAGGCLHYTDAAAQSAYGVNAYTTFKATQDGDFLWGANHRSVVWDLAIDGSGNVYTSGRAVNDSGAEFSDSIYEGGGPTGNRTGYYTTRAYNNSGSLLWSADHGFCLKNDKLSIACANGYVYTGGNNYDSTGNLTKYHATTGEKVWSVGDYLINDIAVDASDNVYVTGLFVTGGSRYILRKYDSSGNLVASGAAIQNDNGEYLNGRQLVIDNNGDIIVATNAIKISGKYKTLHKFNSSCVLQFSNGGDMDISVNGMGIDTDNNIYLCRKDSYGGTGGLWAAVKVNADFSTFVDFSSYAWYKYTQNGNNETEDAWCLAVRAVDTPALRIPLTYGIPTTIGDAYTIAPAMALNLGLGLPYPWREYPGADLPNVLRLFLPGSPALELAVVSVQLRADVDRTSVTVVVRIPDLATLETLEARLNQPMLIQRGVRFRDGLEQLETLALTPLSAIAADFGADSASLTLAGSAVTILDQSKTRTLQGVSYRNVRNGARRVRCAVDTHLRPLDTVNLGGSETMIVAEIVIYQAVDQATMEVSE